MIAIPVSAGGITADWLSAALQDSGTIACRVGKAELEPIAEAIGNLSAIQRCRLYARFWNGAAIERFEWMPLHDERQTMNYAESWDRFVEVYGVRIEKDALATRFFASALEIDAADRLP